MTAPKCGPLAVACLIALTFAVSGAGAAHTDANATSTVGWVRLAQLSHGASAIDWYVYPSGSTNARVAVKDVAFGSFSPYESLTPGNYLVAVHTAGNAPTGNPLTTAQITVAAGQAYTVAGLGATSVPTLRVLNDKLDTTQGKVGVRVLDASQQNPTVSVSAGDVTIATDVQYPNFSDYQPVAAGAGTVRVSTQSTGAGASTGATARVNFVAGSTYTVVVLDGSGSAPQVLELRDASGVGVAPKGGVSTGFGGMAAAHEAGAGGGVGVGAWVGVRVGAGLVLLLMVAGGAVSFGMGRRRGSVWQKIWKI